MLRVHFWRVMFASGLFCLQACSSAPVAQIAQITPVTPLTNGPSTEAPVSVDDKPMTTKIIRFADALGAVAIGARLEDAKYESMLAAFDYCAREQRLAFITSPLPYSPRLNYARVSTFSNRLPEDPNASAYVAPFECLDQKHSAKTGLLESEDMPSTHELERAMKIKKAALSFTVSRRVRSFA